MNGNSTSVSLIDHQQHAAVLDLILALGKSRETSVNFAISAGIQDLMDGETYDIYWDIAYMAGREFNIIVDPDVLRHYVALLRTPTPNAEIGAFMQRVYKDASLRQQFSVSATSYDAVANVAKANGLDVTPQELKDYIEPWAIFVSLLRGLLDQGDISEQQFTQYAGFASSDASLSGTDQDMDVSIMGGLFSAAEWATKGTEYSSLNIPISTVVFPATAIIIGGLSGESYSWSHVEEMFKNSYLVAMDVEVSALMELPDMIKEVSDVVAGAFASALDAMSGALQDFESSVSNLFGS